MTDIAPELLEKVQQSFEAETASLKEEIANGVKSYEEAYSYAIKVGEALSKSFGVNITPEVLPDGMMYYNIADKVVRPMLRAEYEISSAAAVQAQRSANKAAGIGIKAQVADFDEERAQGIIDRVSSQPFEEVSWLLNEPVKSFSKNVVDQTLEKNVEFQGKSGLSPKIRRTANGETCEWCQAVAGTYEYPNVPKDVYRRHANCDCVVEYIDGGKYQDVWTKKISSKSQLENIEARKLIGLGENEQSYKPVIINRDDKKQLQRDVSINLSKLENLDYDIYVSDKTTLKPREQQVIVQSIRESLKYIDTSANNDMPMFAIISDSEMASNALAAYNYVENCIFLRRTAGNKNQIKAIQIDNGFACPGDADSTMLHELLHWKDASDYRLHNGAITAENAAEYQEYIRQAAKSELDNLGINADNVGEISDYAEAQYMLGGYDETHTEYRVRSALR